MSRKTLLEQLEELFKEENQSDDLAQKMVNNFVTISDNADSKKLQGKTGRITDVVNPNSDPCVFYFESEDDGQLSGWVFFDEITIVED
jgi:beta-lactamase class D